MYFRHAGKISSTAFLQLDRILSQISAPYEIKKKINLANTYQADP